MTAPQTCQGLRRVPQAPLPGPSTALHSTGSPSPSLRTVCCQHPAQELPRSRERLFPEWARGSLLPGGQRVQRRLASSGSSPVSGLVTALGVVQSPHALVAMASAVVERSRGDPKAPLSPNGSPQPALPHQGPREPEVCQALVLLFRLLLQLLMHQGQVAPQHSGCRMLPPAVRSQAHCQEQHRFTS